MILSALVHRRKRFKDKHKRDWKKNTLTSKVFGLFTSLCGFFRSVPWWVLTQTSKVAWLRRRPCAQKTLKVSDFGLQSNHWLQNAYMLERFYGEAPVLSFQRWARAQHSCFDAFLCYLCAKKNINVSHEMLCPWRLISSHLTVHMKFDSNFYQLNFFFFGWGSG